MVEDPSPRTHQRLVVGLHADAAQRCVALDRAVDVALRRLVVTFPRAIRPLRFQQRSHDVRLTRVAVLEEVHRQQPLGFHRVVGLEHADPESVRQLLAVEPANGFSDRGVDLLGRLFEGSRS